jgi:hypothetical protein
MLRGGGVCVARVDRAYVVAMRASLVVALSVLAVAAVAPRSAEAAPDVKRRGGQFEGMFGVSACIPGKADCKSNSFLDGKTGPSFGMGFTLGFRPIRSLLIGGAYNVGFFNPDYVSGTRDVYKAAYQNSVFGVIRAILPIWRVDLGLELAPGWSRQAFTIREDSLTGTFTGATKEFSQGFALKVAPVVDFYITRRLFIGAKVDFIFNFHRQVCRDFEGGSRSCGPKDGDRDKASVHQVIAGFHIGATF